MTGTPTKCLPFPAIRYIPLWNTSVFRPPTNDSGDWRPRSSTARQPVAFVKPPKDGGDPYFQGFFDRLPRNSQVAKLFFHTTFYASAACPTFSVEWICALMMFCMCEAESVFDWMERRPMLAHHMLEICGLVLWLATMKHLSPRNLVCNKPSRWE
jgi:hypothetical protein